jgi:hypothetical protein
MTPHPSGNLPLTALKTYGFFSQIFRYQHRAVNLDTKTTVPLGFVDTFLLGVSNGFQRMVVWFLAGFDPPHDKDNAWKSSRR